MCVRARAGAGVVRHNDKYNRNPNDHLDPDHDLNPNHNPDRNTDLNLTLTHTLSVTLTLACKVTDMVIVTGTARVRAAAPAVSCVPARV